MGRKRLNRGYSFKLYRGVSNNGLMVSLVLRINGQRIIREMKLPNDILNDDLARNTIRGKKLQGEERKSFLPQLHPDRKANNAFLHKTTGQLNHIIDDFEVRKIPYIANMIIDKLFASLKSSSVEKFLLSEIENLKGSKANMGSPETYPFSNQYGTRTGQDSASLP